MTARNTANKGAWKSFAIAHVWRTNPSAYSLKFLMSKYIKKCIYIFFKGFIQDMFCSSLKKDV